VLAELDAGPMLDAEGRIAIDRLRRHVEARLGRTPVLRQVVYRPGFLRGRTLLVDDPSFRIEEHVMSATLPAPGGEPAALAFAEREMARLLDRSRPLWAIWLLDGYGERRLGLLIKLHHAIADGPAMINLLAQILDLEPMPPETASERWTPAPAPSQTELIRDNLRQKLRALATPAAALRPSALRAIAEELRQASGAPPTSFNRPVGVERRITALHLPLDEARGLAHRLGVRLNDVFVYVVTRSLREVLLRRGEDTAGMALHISVAVSQQATRATSASGNHAGTVVVAVPIDLAGAREQLDAVAAATAQAKARQLAVISMNFGAALAQTGVARAYTRRQHMINVLTTNLPGPPVPLYLAGARVSSPVALPPIAGNVTVSFAALSYESELALSVVADAAAWPDFSDLAAALPASYRELQRLAAAEMAPAV
jgi:WS/DGAT/MGAT family acyltransferase